MDSATPANIQILSETLFNPELSEELNLNFGFHYSATSTLMQHVLREMDGRTLFRLYAMRMGLFGEASLAEMLEEQRRDVCPVCLFGNFEVLSEVLIMPCCGIRYHTYCINPYSRCPTCRCNRPTIGWVGFQSHVSYFTWDDWRGRIDRILNIEPVRAIVPLVRALTGTHSDKLKYDAAILLFDLAPNYNVSMADAGIRETLMELISDDDWCNLATTALRQATDNLFHRLCELQEDDQMPNAWFQRIRTMLMYGSSQIVERELRILQGSQTARSSEFAGDVVPLLADTDMRVRKAALSVLYKFDPAVLAPYIDEVSSLVVAVLSAGGNDEVMLDAARVLETLACYSDDNMVAIERAGALRPLVLMLSSGGTDEVKHAAVRALWPFSFNIHTGMAIAREGVFRPIVAMLSASLYDEARRDAAGVLENLARDNNDNRVAIERAGAIPPLVAMLSAGDGIDEVNEAAAYALGNLSKNDDNKAVIAREGAIRPLVWMLSSLGSERLKTAAANVLDNLSQNDDNSVVIAREGAIRPLVLMLNASSADGVKTAAARVLRNLAYNNDNKVDIEREGAIPLLFAMLSVGGNDNVNASAVEALRIFGIEPTSHPSSMP